MVLVKLDNIDDCIHCGRPFHMVGITCHPDTLMCECLMGSIKRYALDDEERNIMGEWLNKEGERLVS